jgi:hypothetical protein
MNICYCTMYCSTTDLIRVLEYSRVLSTGVRSPTVIQYSLLTFDCRIGGWMRNFGSHLWIRYECSGLAVDSGRFSIFPSTSMHHLLQPEHINVANLHYAYITLYCRRLSLIQQLLGLCFWLFRYCCNWQCHLWLILWLEKPRRGRRGDFSNNLWNH